MTFFLAASVIPRGRGGISLVEVASEAPPGIDVVDITPWPMGHRVAGNTDRVAFLVNVAGDATDLIGRGAERNSKVTAGRTFLAGLVATYGGISLLVHFSKGRLEAEQVNVEEHIRLDPRGFEQMFPRLKLNVRYVVVR